MLSLTAGTLSCKVTVRQYKEMELMYVPLSVQATSDGSHIDALKKLNHHLEQTFVRDFPFYLVLAYRMYM